MNNLENLFQSPSAAYRGKPFWSWNGKLEKDELLRQIQIFKEMGMGGYFCPSRKMCIRDSTVDDVTVSTELFIRDSTGPVHR